MGWDYALVHLYYNIPPAVLLTACYYPLCTKVDIYKVLFLILIAVVSTTPWDSYLIRRRIWTYPSNAIIGPTLFGIPAEEIFFFIIQTYNTSLLYLLASKPTFHPIHLRGEKLLHDGPRLRLWRWLGAILLAASILAGAEMIMRNGRGLYLGLIIVWAGPFILLLWTLSYQLLINLPISNTVFPILAPTWYLWIVDTIALRRGTWVIVSGTKLGWHLWDGLDLEYGPLRLQSIARLTSYREAFFFLVTNTLIVLGLVAFDNALAILNTFPDLFPDVQSLPSPVQLVKALLVRPSRYEDERILGLQDALKRLRKKSRSFYLASGCFQGRLRIDLILLYSFCRVADDLIDNAKSGREARHWILKLTEYLDICYAKTTEKSMSRDVFVQSTFPRDAQSALLLLPTAYLSPTPLYDLVQGFETDLDFSVPDKFPINDEQTLQTYGSRVAGTVAELCLELSFHHANGQTSEQQRRDIVRAGGRMGIALQYVNIARDIAVDAKNNRVYIPTNWLKSEGLQPKDVLEDPSSSGIELFRQKLLDNAMEIYDDAKGAIDLLPSEPRGPMRVAVESYVEIGRVLRLPGYRLKAGRATVPKLRRLRVAWTALSQG
ncbi:MAG: hypothetical protein L6R40_001080 [Gallowayella cf. fulva]|nr:MAG: hypothetical protein L6R40_001080 [Xanthomendoza cf. fulva]